MPAVTREAESTWKGTITGGSGTITAASTGAFVALPFSLPTRVGEHGGSTSPEELLAAAHAGCFAMSLSNELTQVEAPPQQLDVSCAITLDQIPGQGFRIVSAALTVRADVPGLDDAALQAAVDAAGNCPFSVLLRQAGAGVTVTVERA